jgi:hypothetical protein
VQVTHELTDEIRTMRAATRRDLRRAHEARATFWRVTVISSFFIVALGASLFVGAVMVLGAIRPNNGPNELTADGRTGRIARSLRDGTLCHYLVFDNKTAQAVEDRIGRCDEGKPKAKQERPAAFSWGGR